MRLFITKQLIAILFTTLLVTNVFAQSAAINTTGASANESAALDITSTTKGLLIPRMTNAQRDAIVTPATSLMVFQTDATAGYYYYNGAAWVAVGGGGGTIAGSGSFNYVPRFTSSTPSTNLGNSTIQDNGITTSVGLTLPSVKYQLYTYRQQQTVHGDGQHSLFGYRTRDNQNDGIGYSQIAANSATAGFNFWGDVYTFGVAGWNYNDYSRCGGTFGADVNGAYWGSLGYRASNLLNYGVYGSAAFTSGGGRMSNTNGRVTNDYQGVGGGFYGGVIGSWTRGEVMGQVNSGGLFAAYNVGNVYTSGHTADLVSNGTKKVAAYSVTSPKLKVYDDGTGELNGTEVFVSFDDDYAGLLGAKPNVTVSAVGSPAQLYIKSISKNGFTVAAALGSVNTQFSWIAVGNRTDAATLKSEELPSEITDINFDNKMKEVMFNEGNKAESGKPIWYDGQKIRFDKAPEMPKAPKVELSPVVQK